MTAAGVRSGSALWCEAARAVRGIFPPGPLVFPVGAAEIVALDAAVRAAAAQLWIVPAGQPAVVPPPAGALRRYIDERLPAFERALFAERTVAAPGELVTMAGTLGVPVDELARRLGGAEAGGGLELAAVTHATLANAVARLAALDALGAPAVITEDARRHALAVATAGWRPVLDPAAWLPDVAGAAAAVDVERPASDPPFAVADMSSLVLFAALCAVGPAARSVTAGPARWRGLGGFGSDPDPVVGQPGAVVVGLAVYDDVVERLEFALEPGGALLAVTLPD